MRLRAFCSSQAAWAVARIVHDTLFRITIIFKCRLYITLGPCTNCFLFPFKGEAYLITKYNAFKMVVAEVSQKNSLNDLELAPSVEKLDWRFQNLTYEEVRKYFNKANLYHNTRKHKFNTESKKRAVEFYLRRCEMAYKQRISEELAIDNIQRIEIDENGYNFRFYFKGTNVFYYFGYPEGSSTSAVW